MKRNILKTTLMCLLFFSVAKEGKAAIARGQAIVNNAQNYLYRPYEDGNPPNVRGIGDT